MRRPNIREYFFSAAIACTPACGEAPSLNTAQEIEACRENLPDLPEEARERLDTDEDGTPDPCDPDTDNDGVLNGRDNCPTVANFEQLDLNGNGVGDACEGTPDERDPWDQDGDEVLFPEDVCEGHMDPTNNFDTCREDLDGDCVGNGLDNCPEVYNPDQGDADRDGIGDECDPRFNTTAGPPREDDRIESDYDEDGLWNWDDNCKTTPNPDQENADGDYLGDACDPDPNIPNSRPVPAGWICDIG